MSVAEQAGAPAAPEPDRAHGVNPWLVLVLVCLGQFMVILDATIVNVALPSIQDDLGFSATELQWVINSYTLVFGGFLLLGGRAADLVGRRGVVMLAALLRKEDVANISP
jgi:MFS family permease